MIFNITYTVDKLQVTDKVTCDTVGDLIRAIELVMNENSLLRNQITVHEQ